MILEREDYPAMNSNSFSDSCFASNFGTYQYRTMGFHHNRYNGFNAAFFDGHVRFYAFSHQPAAEAEAPLEAKNWR